MILDGYQRLAGRTMNGQLTAEETEAHALHGMVAEVGEIHSLYQKHYQGHRIDPEALMGEVGDLLWFVAEFCTVMGWSLDEVAEFNLAKLRKRYPDGFDEERSLHREGEA